VTAPLLETESVSKYYPILRSASEYFGRAAPRNVHAVDAVSITVGTGETLGLIGESGSGKTTLGWVVSRIIDPTAGTIRFEGTDVGSLRGPALRAWRRNVQVVFQDPIDSLDPQLKVWQIVSEPMRVQEHLSRAEARAGVAELLPTVGLPPDCLDQFPHEFSGGGRQRLSVARALSVNPKLIVLDEPTSALDVAVQAQVLNRLVRLQKERDVAYLLITHNVAAVRYAADRVAVMYLGQIVEVGGVRDVLERPVHPYTKALIAAVPLPDVRRRRTRYRVTGEIPTLINPKPGCRFAPRCPFVVDTCRTVDPELRDVPGFPGRQVACHRAEDVAGVDPSTLLAPLASATEASGPSSVPRPA